METQLHFSRVKKPVSLIHYDMDNGDCLLIVEVLVIEEAHKYKWTVPTEANPEIFALSQVAEIYTLVSQITFKSRLETCSKI